MTSRPTLNLCGCSVADDARFHECGIADCRQARCFALSCRRIIEFELGNRLEKMRLLVKPFLMLPNSCIDSVMDIRRFDELILRLRSDVLGSCNNTSTFLEPKVRADRPASL